MVNDDTNLSNAECDVEKVIMLWAGVHKSRGKITRNLVLTLKLKTKYKIAALFVLQIIMTLTFLALILVSIIRMNYSKNFYIFDHYY